MILQNRVRRECAEQMQRLATTGGDEQAHLQVQLCMAGVVCPAETRRLAAAMESRNGEAEAEAAVQGCLEGFQAAMRHAVKKAAAEGK